MDLKFPLPHLFTFSFCITLLCFFYHYERNGNPLNLGQFASRTFWSLAFALAAFLYSMNVSVFILCFFTGFLEILIPHAFGQNMGTLGRPWTLNAQGQYLGLYKWWPGCWLPFPKTQAEFDATSNWKRTMFDFLGLASTGLVRGLIVFGSLCVTHFWMPFGLQTFGLDIFHALIGIVGMMIALPVCYLVGRFTPWKIWNNEPGATWGEFYTGIAWAIIMGMAFYV